MKVQSALTALLLLLLSMGCVRSATSQSCLALANGETAAALERYKRGDNVSAAALQTHAASKLEQCLTAHPNELSASSRQRLGELWMYAGEYRLNAGEFKAATNPLERAANVFSELRLDGALSGTTLDEVLLDAHTTDKDLARVKVLRARGPTPRPTTSDSGPPASTISS